MQDRQILGEIPGPSPRVIRGMLAVCAVVGGVLLIQQWTWVLWGPVAFYDDGVRSFDVQRFYDWPLTVVSLLAIVGLWVSLSVGGKARVITLTSAIACIGIYYFGLWSFLYKPSGGGLFSEWVRVRVPERAGPTYGNVEGWHANRVWRQLGFDYGAAMAATVAIGLVLAVTFVLERVVAERRLGLHDAALGDPT